MNGGRALQFEKKYVGVDPLGEQRIKGTFSLSLSRARARVSRNKR